ncbi:pentapeptide repeat-containing protein [Coleofasciculus sp. LEGE 07081]|uniref:pentapeptide repeat-containing protein n=1 Tax=Coleofasciculus sp. LEGE 07081 TaxID=2777967 RepID=UPI00187DF012|nr:pentapeptide repeat-containing protein [Coleofasciculus sp. LEGE 07081]MBE9130163.1 pentapeptide repeat-containing protein [Coleofasciculus sp. LEGE 07081]
MPQTLDDIINDWLGKPTELLSSDSNIRAYTAHKLGQTILHYVADQEASDNIILPTTLNSMLFIFSKALEREDDHEARKEIEAAMAIILKTIPYNEQSVALYVDQFSRINRVLYQKLLTTLTELNASLTDFESKVESLFTATALFKEKTHQNEFLRYILTRKAFHSQVEKTLSRHTFTPYDPDESISNFFNISHNINSSKKLLAQSLSYINEPLNIIDNPWKLSDWKRKSPINLTHLFFPETSFGANLQGANLHASILIGSYLAYDSRGLRCSGCNLSYAKAVWVNLDGAVFSGSSLRFANFGRTSMRFSAINDCDAAHAIFRKADLRHANLRGSNFVGADFEDAELGEASIAKIKVAADDGSFADFSKSNWIEADFWNIGLTPGGRRSKDQQLKQILIKLQRQSHTPMKRSLASNLSYLKQRHHWEAPRFKLTETGDALHDLSDDYRDVLSNLPPDIDEASAQLCRIMSDLWMDVYCDKSGCNPRCIDLITEDGYTYIIDSTESSSKRPEGSDVPATRVIAAYGYSQAPREGREQYFMKIPLSFRKNANKKLYDRGHFIGYAIGGTYQFNLYAQRRDVNQGITDTGKTFTSMERYARNNLGILVYSRARYDDLTAHPAIVEYGLLKLDGELLVFTFDNRIENPDN